jgi:hypothetical protein
MVATGELPVGLLAPVALAGLVAAHRLLAQMFKHPVEPAGLVEMVPWVAMVVREAMPLRMVMRLHKPRVATAAMGETRVVLVGRAAQAQP